MSGASGAGSRGTASQSARRLLDAVDQPYVLLRRDGGHGWEIAEVNSAACTALGGTRGALLFTEAARSLGEAVRAAVDRALAHGRADQWREEPCPVGGAVAILRVLPLASGLDGPDAREVALSWHPSQSAVPLELVGLAPEDHLASDLVESIARNSTDVIVHTVDGRVEWVSPSVTDVVGWSPSDLVGRPFGDFVHPRDRTDLLRVSAVGTVRRRRRMSRPDGTYIWMEGQSRPFVTPDGRTEGVLSQIHSVDAEQKARIDLEHERALLQAALESMLDAYSLLTAVRDEEGRIVDFRYSDVNAATLAHFGVKRQDIVGSTLLSRAPGRRSGLFEVYVHAMETGEPIVVDDYRDPDPPPGRERYLDIRGIRVGDGISFTMRDVTDRWRAREALRQRAELDELTGLVNRGEVLRRLDRVVDHPARSGVGTALAFCDVDGFKAVNDLRGHALGDIVLREVGQRMAGALRASDTVARFGGDEFLIVLEGIDDVESARTVVEQMRRTVLEPLVIDGEPISVGLSCGVVMLDRSLSVSRHVTEADRAMFEAKRSGGGVVTATVTATADESGRFGGNPGITE